MNSNSFSIGEVLTRAWQIVWKFKILWIFGILASCSNNGGGGSGGSGGSGSGFDFSNGDVPPQMRELARAMERLGAWMENNLWIIAVILSVLCIIWIVAIFIGTIGKIGLIKGAQMADDGAQTLGFGEVWNASLPYFWRVLGFTILTGLVILAAMFFVILPIIVVGAITIVGLFCVVPLICLLVPVLWAVGVIIEQAIIAMVVEDRSMLEGLSRSWDVVRANIGQYILMALVLFIGGAVVGLVIAIPVFLIVFPAVFAVALGEGSGINTGLMIAGLCFVLYLPVSIVLSGVLVAYIQTAWTLTFRRLTTPPPAMEVEPESNQPLDLSDAPA